MFYNKVKTHLLRSKKDIKRNLCQLKSNNKDFQSMSFKNQIVAQNWQIFQKLIINNCYTIVILVTTAHLISQPSDSKT